MSFNAPHFTELKIHNFWWIQSIVLLFLSTHYDSRAFHSSRACSLRSRDAAAAAGAGAARRRVGRYAAAAETISSLMSLIYIRVLCLSVPFAEVCSCICRTEASGFPLYAIRCFHKNAAQKCYKMPLFYIRKTMNQDGQDSLYKSRREPIAIIAIHLHNCHFYAIPSMVISEPLH